MPLATILQPLGGDFGTATAAELILVGASCGAVGVWVVQFGRAFLAESFTHALLPGLVLAAIFNASLVLGALVGIAIAYALTLLVAQAPRTSSASATSVSVTLLVAIGALLASTGNSPIAFESLLFGNPLAASARDLYFGGGLAIVIAVVMVAMHWRFTTLAFDPEAAASLGIRVAGTGAILLALLVFSITVAANVAGSLLALVLVTGPAVGALSATRSIGRAIALAAAIGALCGVGGIYVSYYANLPASSCVALLAAAAAVLPGGVSWIANSLAARSAEPALQAGP